MSERTLTSVPSLPALYARAAITGPLHRGESLPQTSYRLDEQAFDPRHLADYDRVCGFRYRDVLPATYLHVLAFPLALSLMTDRSFPFGVLGLVHIENRIEHLRPVGVEEIVDLRVVPADLREHDRGRAVDLVAEASVEGELVWRGTSTYLHREGGGGSGSSERKRPEPPRPTALGHVRGDIARRYAEVSGDRNPIHLHPLSAKLFGMPGAIAHGMWVKARCLAALEGMLPAAFTVDVRFKAPMKLPAKVAFADWPGDGATREFAVHDARKGRPHLTGAVSPS
jgi:acyl dehydratase